LAGLILGEQLNIFHLDLILFPINGLFEMSRAVSGPIAPSALVGLEFSFDLLNFEDMLPLPQ
jgi:hypothetical protein